jgi:hypothetical protein
MSPFPPVAATGLGFAGFFFLLFKPMLGITLVPTRRV